MRAKIISFFKYSIFLLIGLGLVWWQLRAMSPADKSEFMAALKRANYWIILPVVIMSILSHVSRSMRWKLLLEPLGYYPALKNVFAVTMIGYITNSAIPRLGEILKCTFLARYENLKTEKLVGTIIIERMFDLLCFVVFVGITVLIQIDTIGGFVKKEISKIGGGGGSLIWIKIIALIAIIAGIFYLLKFLLKKYPNNKVIAKVNGFLIGIKDGFLSIKKLQKRKAFVAHTLFIWSMYLLQIYIGFYAMEGTTGLGIKAAFGVLTLATLAMIATPNGLGTFPIFVRNVLVIYGIAKSTGLAFGWLMWGVSTGIIITFGVLAFIFLPYMNKDKAHLRLKDLQNEL